MNLVFEKFQTANLSLINSLSACVQLSSETHASHVSLRFTQSLSADDFLTLCLVSSTKIGEITDWGKFAKNVSFGAVFAWL
jgi:hypothetical protein